MKQKNNGIKRLLEFTGNKRGVLNLSRILSGISAIFILGPFLCVYFAARDLVDVFTGSPLDTESLVRWGIIALALELIGLLLYFCALLCSHVAAFHSFIAKTGTTTALVGHSGSGKSTTASLIPRFYDAGEGKIKIGGIDIQEIAHKDLMQMVAFVFQNPKLFKDSLLENIRAGRPNATREEVLQAAHMAQCDDILAKFPQGIDTVVGSKGVYLSGGETQRIAIARAILKNAPIIVLDEATAYADPENEQQIQQAFEGLTKGKTVIMIAHRLSTIQDADQILVMKQGKLAEQGTHTSLVEQNGEYARMWENYTKTTQWHIGNEVKVC